MKQQSLPAVLAIAFCCMSLFATAQKTKPAAAFNKILVGVNFSPDYDFRKLKNIDGSASSDLVINSRNDVEIAKFGFTTGLDFCFNFSKLIGLETGIQYSNKGYKTKKQDLVFGFPDPSLPSASKIISSFQYIDIPVKANFTFGTGKLHFIAAAGLAVNIFIDEKQTSIYEYTDGRTEKKKQSTNTDYKKINISPLVSLGIDYRLNNKMNLKAEPTFRYGVLKIIDSPVTGYLWNAGFNIAFYYGIQ